MIKIKQATTREEALAIAVLAKKVWEHTYIPIIGKAQVDYMLDKFQSAAVVWESIEAGIYDYRLSYIEDQLGGYLAFQQKNEEVFISKLYVDPDRQK